MSCSLEKSSKNHKLLEKWAKPNLSSDVTPRPANFYGEYFRRICHMVSPDPPELFAVFSAQFKLKMVSDVLLLSYLDKIGLSLTGEAGQASAYLYSEARLYKGASLALLSQSATTRSTGNISVGVKKVGHSNTRGTVSSLFFPAQINCCT